MNQVEFALSNFTKCLLFEETVNKVHTIYSLIPFPSYFHILIHIFLTCVNFSSLYLTFPVCENSVLLLATSWGSSILVITVDLILIPTISHSINIPRYRYLAIFCTNKITIFKLILPVSLLYVMIKSRV